MMKRVLISWRLIEYLVRGRKICDQPRTYRILWVYGLYDAYKTAERINKGEERFSGKSRLFWLGACFLILVFLFPFVLSAVFMSEMSHDYGSMTTEKIVSVSAQKPGRQSYCSHLPGRTGRFPAD